MFPSGEQVECEDHNCLFPRITKRFCISFGPGATATLAHAYQQYGEDLTRAIAADQTGVDRLWRCNERVRPRLDVFDILEVLKSKPCMLLYSPR